MLSNLLILCHPLLLPSIFPSIRVFPNELTLYIRWPNYWNFSFSINPSSEYSGVFSFRIAPKKEICHCFHFSLTCLPWCDGATLHDFSFFVYWVLSQLFHTSFSPSSKDSLVSLLSAIRMVSSIYLRLLIFLLVVLIPTCDSSSLTFCMRYSG